jgi:hypothetical protein
VRSPMVRPKSSTSFGAVLDRDGRARQRRDPPLPAIPGLPEPARLGQVFDRRLTPNRLRIERHQLDELGPHLLADGKTQTLRLVEGDRVIVRPRPLGQEPGAALPFPPAICPTTAPRRFPVAARSPFPLDRRESASDRPPPRPAFWPLP